MEPILHWSGSGDWTTGQWQLADGLPTPWIDGSSVVLANGSDLNVSGSVNVGTITVAGDATIEGDTLSLPSWSGMITVLSGTATIDAAVAGGNLTETGPGTLILNGTITCAGVTVAGGMLDPNLPLPIAPVVAGGRVIGPAAVFSANGQSLCDLDPALFDLVGSLFADQSIDRSDMIQILESVAVDGALTTDALRSDNPDDAAERGILEHARRRGGFGQRRGVGQSRQCPLSGPALGKPGGPDERPVASHSAG